jgi:pSer/pThr/pTyr-binding forkhead associated (FHA) protein
MKTRLIEQFYSDVPGINGAPHSTPRIVMGDDFLLDSSDGGFLGVGGFLGIGSDKDRDIKIEGIAGRQCSIKRYENGYKIADFEGNGTLVNGRVIPRGEIVELRDLNSIEFPGIKSSYLFRTDQNGK